MLTAYQRQCRRNQAHFRAGMRQRTRFMETPYTPSSAIANPRTLPSTNLRIFRFARQWRYTLALADAWGYRHSNRLAYLRARREDIHATYYNRYAARGERRYHAPFAPTATPLSAVETRLDDVWF